MKKNSKRIVMPVRNDNDNSNYISKPKRKKKKKLNFLSLVFVVFLLYFLTTITSQNKMMKDLNEQIAEKELQRDIVKKKEESLAKDVESLDDKETMLKVVERIARNEYKMVKHNETIYIDKNKMHNKFIMGIGYDAEKLNSKDKDGNEE